MTRKNNGNFLIPHDLMMIVPTPAAQNTVGGVK